MWGSGLASRNHLVQPSVRGHRCPLSVAAISLTAVQDAAQLVEHVLADEDLDDSDVQPAPKLMEIVLQNCRGRVDACVAPYLTLALRRLHASGSPYLQARLLTFSRPGTGKCHRRQTRRTSAIWSEAVANHQRAVCAWAASRSCKCGSSCQQHTSSRRLHSILASVTRSNKLEDWRCMGRACVAAWRFVLL